MPDRLQFESLRRSVPAVLPSLLMCDFGNLQREVARLEEAGVAGLHLDVMDGHFVPNLTYGMPLVAALRKLTRLPLDVHLMISEPSRYIRAFQEAGADAITFHVEAVNDPRPLLTEIRELGIAGGLAINPDTPLARLESSIELCNLALVMSVPAGFGGQEFRANAVERLQHVRQLAGPQLLLEVDGGIAAETIGRCAQAGAQLFVVGSALFRQPAYGTYVAELRQRAEVHVTSIQG
jgi:ribulose-phosphate 3-epimerase